MQTAFFGMATAIALAVAPSAQAQEGAPPAAPVQTEVSDEQLRTFAEAYLDVQEIAMANQDALAEVSDPAEAQALQAQAQTQMTSAVEEHGLAPEEYAGLANTVNADEALQMRFAEIVQALMDEENGPGLD